MSEHARLKAVPNTLTVNNQPAKPTVAAKTQDIEYSASPRLAARLAKLNVSFAFTSYQSNILYLVGRNGRGGINIHQSAMVKPMGLYQNERSELILSGGYQIMRLQNVLEPNQRINQQFDGCYVPRTVHTTGQLSDGGIVMDIQSNKIICRGLSMPHSPRVHNGELWVLNSGTGELGVVKPAADGESEGHFEARAFCPGFVRGLAFTSDYAFVGLSKPRYKRFEGLDLDARLNAVDSDPWCGIQIIQLSTGTCVDWLRIDGQLAELYDLEVIPGVVAPMALPPESKEAAQLITYADML